MAEAGFQPLPFDAVAALAFALVAASPRSVGHKPGWSLDTLIAAIAAARQLPLYTCNVQGSYEIGGLELRTGNKIAAGLQKVVLLGTLYTMEQEFYLARLRDKFGLDVVVLERPARQRL